MRWIVISLVVINVLVLIWQLATLEPKPVAAATPNSRIADAPQIKLLNEVEEEALQAMVADRERVRLTEGVSTDEPESPLCTLVGPFERILRAEYFVERLQALDVRSQVQEVEIPGGVNYWVYLPSQGSRKEAIDKLREIQSKSIDSYVIPRGDLENAISFGVFSQKTLADQRLEAVQELGYEAILSERERSTKEVWVILEPGEAQHLDQESWLSVMANENNLQRRQNYCPTAVASD